jgi:hypothetical protein
VIDPDHIHFRKTTKLNSATSIYARSYTMIAVASSNATTAPVGKALYYVYPKVLIGAASAATSGGYVTAAADSVNTTSG